MPSEGHPFPLSGSQNGEEYGRVPTSVIGVPPLAPVTVHAAGAFLIGQGMFGPPAVAGGGKGKGKVRFWGEDKVVEICGRERPGAEGWRFFPCVAARACA